MLIHRSVMQQRFEALMAVVRAGLPVVEVAAKFAVSVGARLTRRYESGRVTALEDRSHRPFACPYQMPPAVEPELYDLRRQLPDGVRPHWPMS